MRPESHFHIAPNFVPLVKFSYWSKFHINIITGPGVVTISFYKGLTRNLEIRNTPVWVLPNIWRLRRVRNIKFGMNVSNKMLLNAAKCQCYSLYLFWVVKGKTNRGVKLQMCTSLLLMPFSYCILVKDRHVVIPIFSQVMQKPWSQLMHMGCLIKSELVKIVNENKQIDFSTAVCVNSC